MQVSAINSFISTEIWIANCSRVLIRAMILLAIIFVNLVGQRSGHIANCFFWKTCLRSMIIINTWHPLIIWQCKHMLRVIRTLLPLGYWSNFAHSFLALGLSTRRCQLEAFCLVGPKKKLVIIRMRLCTHWTHSEALAGTARHRGRSSSLGAL